MLNLVDRKKKHQLTILETEFTLKSLSVKEKFGLMEKLATLKLSSESFDELVRNICEIVFAIEKHEGEDVKKVLHELEDMKDLLTIVKALVDFCALPEESEKNSDSLLGR